MGGVEGGGWWGCLQSRLRHPVLRDAEKRGERWESSQRRNVEFSLRRKTVDKVVLGPTFLEELGLSLMNTAALKL